jgi:hypothetical protein
MIPAERPSAGEVAYGKGTGIPPCPECGCRDFRVINTWYNADGTIRRLRKCRHCGRPFHSSEVIEG